MQRQQGKKEKGDATFLGWYLYNVCHFATNFSNCNCKHSSSITQRGNRRKSIFFIDEDRKVYIERLTECCQKHHHVQILAYCLMTNHVHLIVIPEDKSITTDTVHWKQLENIIDWSGWLNDSEDKKQLNIVRRNIQKNLPCGTDASQRVRKIPDRRCN